MGRGKIRLKNLPALIQVTFVSVLTAAAWLRPLPRSRQLMVSKLAVIAIVVFVLAQLGSRWLSSLASSVLQDWLPAPLLLVPYWQIGCFFTNSDAQTEGRLHAFDRAFFRSLGIQPAKVSISLAAGVYLELAYVMVYPLIPLGLVILYLTGRRDFVNYYWIAVLAATYICLTITPFVRAMPPRSLSDYEKFKMPSSRVKMLNHWILRRAGIHAITFPSAHVASALAAALVLLRLEPWVGLIFLGAALSIAMATVVGGYHYAADVLLAVLAVILLFVATFSILKPG